MKKIIQVSFIFLIHPAFSQPQDLRGAEIHYQHLSGFQYQFDIYYYAQTSMGGDHSRLYFFNNDSFSDSLTGVSVHLPNDITEWHYTTNHIFPGSGFYAGTSSENYRLNTIININDTTPPDLATNFNLNMYAGLANSSPVLQNRQTEVYQSGGYFIHYPNAFDADGDSLVFSLEPTMTWSYSMPPGITIDAATGFVQMPVTTDIYAINIRIDELRMGHIVGTTFRDMLIDPNAIVGIHEIEKNNAILLFPNPTSSSFRIKSQLINPHLEIFSTLGERIYSAALKNENIELNAAAGIYFVKVTEGEKVYTQKLVIQ
jgi:hypothetical protein